LKIKFVDISYLKIIFKLFQFPSKGTYVCDTVYTRANKLDMC